MRLILIRHAKAEERSTSRYPDDTFRPLTAQGCRDQEVLSRAWHQMGIRFDVLATSPLVRARETAEILALGMQWKEPIIETDLLGLDFTINGVLKWLDTYPNTTCMACVGHEPDLSELAGALISEEGEVGITFKKSGILAIDCPHKVRRGQGVLRYFLHPGMLLDLVE